MTLNIDELLEKIPNIDSEADYWYIRTQGGRYYTDFNLNSYIGIGYNTISLEDIKGCSGNQDSLRQLILDSKAENESNENDESQPGRIAGTLNRFVNKLSINDFVIIPSKSADNLLVGRITGDVYEVDDPDTIYQNYHKSNYKKRIPVRWIGSFKKDSADANLYKMIFSHQAVFNVNSYKTFINRELYDVYIEEGILHLTFNVTSTDNANGKYLGQFMYYYTSIYETLFPDEEMEIKVNVQSPGPIETIVKNPLRSLVCFGVVASVLSAPYGGKFKIGSDLLGTVEVEVPGIVSGHLNTNIEREKLNGLKLDNNQAQLDMIDDVIEKAVSLKVPVSELGIEFPEDLMDSIQQEVDRQLAQDEEKEEPYNEAPAE